MMFLRVLKVKVLEIEVKILEMMPVMVPGFSGDSVVRTGAVRSRPGLFALQEWRGRSCQGWGEGRWREADCRGQILLYGPPCNRTIIPVRSLPYVFDSSKI